MINVIILIVSAILRKLKQLKQDDIDLWLKFLHSRGVPIDKNPELWTNADYVLMHELTMLSENLDNAIKTGVLKEFFKNIKKQNKLQRQKKIK
jgi:hypothetical protein